MKYFIFFFLSACQTIFASDGIELFRDRYFHGHSERLTQNDANLYDNGIGHGKIYSIRVPRGCSVVLYEGTNFRGHSITLSRSTEDLSRMLPERIGSVRLLWAQTQSTYHDPPRGQTIPDRRVSFFEHPGFRGRQQVFTNDVSNLRGTHIGNDSISSLTIPRGYAVTLYEHKNFRGDSEVISYDDRNLEDNRIGTNRVSSFRIHRTNESRRKGRGYEERWADRNVEGSWEDCAYEDRRESKGITLFGASEFRGRRQTFSHDVANLRHTQIGNDAVNSIQVPSGYIVTLYAHKNFKGRSETFYGNDRNLADNHIGTNRASSIRIQREDSYGGNYRGNRHND